jgi:hypothetical protein
VLRLRTFAALIASVLCGVFAAWAYFTTDGEAFLSRHPSIQLNWVIYTAVGMMTLGAWGLEQMKEHRR